MSIRFRCAYCNQLMAIGTRKGGTVVNCPNCHNALVVPMPQDAAGVLPKQPTSAHAEPQLADPQTVPGNVFEHNDFVNLFEQQVEPPRPQVLKPPLFSEGSAPLPVPPLPAASFVEYDAIPVSTAPRSANGIHIPSPVLAAVCAIMIVLLGLAFFLGLLVGRSG